MLHVGWEEAYKSVHGRILDEVDMHGNDCIDHCGDISVSEARGWISSSA